MNPYEDEPIASQEILWLEQYHKEMRQDTAAKEEFTKRRDGIIPVSDW